MSVQQFTNIKKNMTNVLIHHINRAISYCQSWFDDNFEVTDSSLIMVLNPLPNVHLSSKKGLLICNYIGQESLQ